MYKNNNTSDTHIDQVCSKGNTDTLFMGMKTCTATIKVNIAVILEGGNRSNSSSIYTTPGHGQKGD